MISYSPENRPEWDALLLGGASGTGKTSVSYRLARHFAVGITEVDDLHLFLRTMTTPEQQPILHYWFTNPEAFTMSPEEILTLHISVCRVLLPAFEAVVLNHVDERTPFVLEGDYLIPELLCQSGCTDAVSAGRVRGVFLYEPDEAQIVRNFLRREPNEGEQTGRARVSWLFGQWLKEDCERRGLIALSARPWDTLLDRVIEAIN